MLWQAIGVAQGDNYVRASQVCSAAESVNTLSSMLHLNTKHVTSCHVMSCHGVMSYDGDAITTCLGAYRMYSLDLSWTVWT